MFKEILQFKKYTFLLSNLIQRDIKVKYKRSILGVVWSVLNPLLMMIVITTVFSKLFIRDVPNFHIYYLTGYTIFSFISEATSMSLFSIIGNASLLKKVQIPKYIFPLEKSLFAFINVLFSMVAVFLVMIGTGFKFTPTMLLFPIPLMYALVFSVGMSLFLSALTVFFRDIVHLYSVFLTAWMYATPIIYPLELIGQSKALSFIVKFNPMYYFVKYFRDVLMYDTIPNISFNLICILISLSSLLIGFFVFSKTQDKFILHI
ncbi:MAG: ABC transporter permease [Oscillospiraceae bacterium]